MNSVDTSKMILAQLSTFNDFATVLKEETQKSIEENKRIGCVYSIWLDEVKQQIITAIKENKRKIEISRLNLNSKCASPSNDPFPQSKLITNFDKGNMQKLIEDLMKVNKSKKRLCHSVESEISFKGKSSSKEKKIDKVKEQPQKMEVIPEQPSREEKEEQQMIPKATPSFSSIININNTKSKVEPPSTSFNNEFTFVKAKKEEVYTVSPIQPMQQEQNAIKPPTVINTNTSKKLKVQQISIIKNIPSSLSTNYNDPEYEITDNSDSDDDDDDSSCCFKKIPRWANDKKFIEEVVIHQNKENLYLDIFGKCKIDHLNLNMIFNTLDEKYLCRNSTADWRMDNTIKSLAKGTANGPKPISTFSTGNNPMFPKTNRQLQFSNTKS